MTITSKKNSQNQIMQLAHDIRSPLMALKSLSESASFESDVKKDLLESTIAHLNNIANELLFFNRNKNSLCNSIVDCVELFREIIITKELEMSFQTKTVQLEMENSSLLDKRYIKINKTELKRALSNVINNAIEACQADGRVSIKLSQTMNNFLRIDITDNGIGIRNTDLEKIMKGQFTNKKNGNGFGVVSLRKYVEKFGGEFEIRSEFGMGTNVEIFLPFYENLCFSKIVLIDDDKLIRDIWADFYNTKQVEFSSFESVEDFEESQNARTSRERKDIAIFIDSELDEGKRGEVEAKKLALKGYENIFLATGHDPSSLEVPEFINGVIGKEPLAIESKQ